jgi:outer membrane protein assembly factor BamD
MRRGAYIAAANRGKYVIENYPRTPAMPDALLIMAKAYKVLGLDDLSDDALRVLKLNYPGHPGVAEIRQTKIVK